MCTSQNGTATAANASRIAIEVWVNAPGLMMMNRVPSVRASCRRSMIAPSWLLWNVSTASPAAAPCATRPASISASVVEP